MQLKGENLANYCWELCRGGDQSLIIIIFVIITLIVQYNLLSFSIKKNLVNNDRHRSGATKKVS